MAKFRTCEECGAKCCKDVSVEIDKPENFEDFEMIKWMIAHKNVIVNQDQEGDWLVEFRTPCKFLGEKNQCKIYDERYKICGEHKADECVCNGNGEYYKVLFKTAEDVDNYMKKTGFYEKYVEEKEKQNKKFSKKNQ